MGSHIFKMKVLAVLGALLATVTCYRSYHGHSVLMTETLSVSKSQLLRDYHVETNLDFWREASPGQSADVMVPIRLMKTVTEWLNTHNIKFDVMVEDVQSLIEETTPKNTSSRSAGKIDWEDYYPHEDLNAFIQGLADANDFAEIINIGQSYEGRDMNVLAITKAGPGKPNVWLEAGIHAREWISPAVATFLVRELVEDYAEHPEYLDNINWYFIPSANPDGYAYTFDTDRLWRKTRSPQGGCYGVDPNRNWGFHWGESGVSSNPCTEIYPGEEPFSEVEMRNIRDFVQTLDPIPVLSQCFHSYSQLWLWPYGYAYNAYPENREEIEQLAIDACDALYQVHGKVFDPINSADLYPAAGASDDWYKGVLGSRFAYTTELRDTGRHGFILPTEEIKPSGEELWEAERVVLKKMIEVSN